ncbi:MAG TPA: hypothetical protein VFJ12_06560 [Segeticoccus sp.]|jgi:hypothetical protein|nr:hypothetical protein [Segeticoccus sp.]
MGTVWTYIAAVLPTAGILYLFWLVMKNLVEADRRERIAHSQWEAAQDAEQIPPTPDNHPN